MPPGAPSAPVGRTAPSGTTPPGTAEPGTTGATGTTGAIRTADAAGRTGRQWLHRVTVVVRRHWLVTALLAAGLVLRVLALAAYHPALIYVDTL